MTESGKKWLIGCAVAAFLLAILLVVIVWGGVTLFKKAAQGIEELEESSDAVSQRFGRASEFTPEPGGEIPGPRVEAFLAARKIMAPARDDMAGSLATLDGSPDSGGEEGKLGAGLRLLPRILKFYEARNKACLEAGLGLGEYGYLYILAYYDLLGKPVTAGPGFPLMGDSNNGGSRGSGANEFDVREDRLERILRASRNLALPILRNQLAAQRSAGTDREWTGRLEEEIALLEADPFRLPWRDGLPDRMKNSLEPYRDRLEESWNEMSNPLEFGPHMH